MSRPHVKDTKKHFTCQLKESDIKWLKEIAVERGLTHNAIIEVGLACFRAQLLQTCIQTCIQSTEVLPPQIENCIQSKPAISLEKENLSSDFWNDYPE